MLKYVVALSNHNYASKGGPYEEAGKHLPHEAEATVDGYRTLVYRSPKHFHRLLVRIANLAD